MSLSSLASKHSLESSTDATILPSIRQSGANQVVSSTPSLLVESTRILPVSRNKNDETVHNTSLRSQSSTSLTLRPNSAKSLRIKPICNSSNLSLTPNSKQFHEIQEKLKTEKHRSELREMTIISLKQQLALLLKDNQESKLTTCHLEQFKNAFSKLESIFEFESESSGQGIDPCVVIARVEQISTETVNLKAELDLMHGCINQLQNELVQEKDISSKLREEIELREMGVLEKSSVATSSNPPYFIENIFPSLQQPQNELDSSIPCQEMFISRNYDEEDSEISQRILNCINRLQNTTSTMDTNPSILELITELENATFQVECNRSEVVADQDRYERLSVENRANRETISRLAAQIQHCEENKTHHDKIVASLKDDTRQAEIQSKCIEAEIISLKLQLDQVINSKSTLTLQLTQLQNSQVNMKKNSTQLSKDKSELEAKIVWFENTLRPLAQYLNEGESIDDHIVSCVEGLTAKTNEVCEANAVISELKARIAELETELHTIQTQSREVEVNNNKLRHELTFFESQAELIERKEQQFTDFCHQLGNDMQLELELNYVIEGGIAYDTLLARAEQLARNETDKLTEKSQAIVSLRNKLKLTQQQLHNKELQLDVAQRRYQALDEKNRDLQATEDASKKASEEHQKIAKDCSQLRKQALFNRNIIQKLKDELEQTSEIRREHKNMTAEITRLDSQLQQLTMDKKRLHQQAARVAKETTQPPPKQETVRIEVDNAKIVELQSENTQLRSEATRTISGLESIRARERELIEIICTISTMLDLPVKTMKKGSKETFIIPTQDDIIAALTDLIQSTRMQQDATRALRESLIDMEKTFRKNVCHTLAYINEDDVTKCTLDVPEL